MVHAAGEGGVRDSRARPRRILYVDKDGDDADSDALTIPLSLSIGKTV